MPDKNDKAALLEDFARLHRGGSSDPIMATCTAVLSLRPVVLANENGVRGTTAARKLLSEAAKAATFDDKPVRAGAALTGIDPPDAGRGVRDDPGPSVRQSAAGDVYGGMTARTMRTKASKFLEAYAIAVLDFVQRANQNDALMAGFLLDCGLSGDAVDQVLGRRPASDATDVSGGPTTVAWPETAGGNEERRASAALHVNLSGVVRQALDTARASCAARNRAFYTYDLLLALLDIPNSGVGRCFDTVWPGLAKRVHEWSHLSLREIAPEHAHPFRPFEWAERDDVRRAAELAAQEHAWAISDVHLLRGVLGSDSTTRTRLAELLQGDFARLGGIAAQMSRESQYVLKTPGPGEGIGRTH